MIKVPKTKRIVGNDLLLVVEKLLPVPSNNRNVLSLQTFVKHSLIRRQSDHCNESRSCWVYSQLIKCMVWSLRENTMKFVVDVEVGLCKNIGFISSSLFIFTSYQPRL